MGNSANSAIPIAAVARRWGFSDASSSVRMFRTSYGLAPREWREQNRHR
jgi:transcriptional regulator GlxA family with amidase domain